MELDSRSNQEDHPVAFVRDWRIRKISPSKGINQDGAPIVRRRTVITIGSVGELKDSSTYGPEEHSISTSEVGETACGRISITVKTLPKTDLIRSNSLFNPDVEEEWPTRDFTSPIQRNKTLVTDPAPWISSAPKDLGRSQSKVWQDEQRPINDTSNGMFNKTVLDSGLRQIDSMAEIAIPKLHHQKISFQQPTVEPKSIHLANQEHVLSSFGKQIPQNTTNLASPTRIQYREWIKSINRPDSPAPNQIPFPSDDAKVTVTTNLTDNYQRNVVVVETAPSPCPPKSILKNGHNDSYSGESKRSDLVVRQETDYYSLNRPISVAAIENNSLMLGRIGISGKVDEKIPYNIPKPAISPNIQDYSQESNIEVDGDNTSVDVTNKNQINSMRSDKASDQKDNTCPSLSSGMAIDKATELVRQFFSTTQPTLNQEDQSVSSIVDKKSLSASESDLLLEVHSFQVHSQSVEPDALPTPVTKKQEVSPQQQCRGRSLIKSKIPLRIPARSSAVCSPSNNKSSLDVTVENRGIVSSRNVSAKPIIGNRVKAYSTARTRSVESSRQTASSLFNPVLLHNGSTARNDGGYDIKAIGYNKNKAITFQQVADRFASYNC